jgi:hypothetical protein
MLDVSSCLESNGFFLRLTIIAYHTRETQLASDKRCTVVGGRIRWHCTLRVWKGEKRCTSSTWPANSGNNNRGRYMLVVGAGAGVGRGRSWNSIWIDRGVAPLPPVMWPVFDNGNTMPPVCIYLNWRNKPVIGNCIMPQMYLQKAEIATYFHPSPQFTVHQTSQKKKKAKKQFPSNGKASQRKKRRREQFIINVEPLNEC